MALRGIFQSRLVWAVVSNGLRVGGYMLVLPITLRTIPEAEMEIWWLFVAVQALVVQADFGLGPSISRGLAYLLAGASSLKPGAAKDSPEVDPARIGGFIQACHRVYRWVLLSALLILVPATFFIVPKMGAGTFSRGSFGNTRAPAAADFIAEVRAGTTPAARWLQQQLPSEVLAGLTVETWNNKPEWDRLMRDLVKEMNRLAVAGRMDQDGRFDGVPLRDETRRLAAVATSGSDLTRANRLLIEDAFPQTILRDSTVLHDAEWRRMVASWFVFAFGVLLTLSTTRFINLLTGADHVRLAQQLSMVGMAANLVITALGLIYGFGFAAMAFGSLGNGICQSVLGRWAFFRHLKPFRCVGDAKFGRACFAELWPTAWRHGVVSLGAFLIYNANTFWASANLGQPESSQYPFSFKLMQILMTICALPVTTQAPKLARMMAAGDPRGAWNFFLWRHAIGLVGMLGGIAFLCLWGPATLRMIGSDSSLLPAGFVLFLGVICFLEFNHSGFALLVMARNEVPFVWSASISGVAIAILGGWWSKVFGVSGLLSAVCVVQLVWHNWWVPWLARRRVRDCGN